MFDVEKVCKSAKEAFFDFCKISKKEKVDMINAMADAILENKAEILKANEEDLKAFNNENKSFYDRLLLNDSRIEAMAEGMKQVAALTDTVGDIIESRVLKNGLKVNKMRSPLGVIGVIYEARPNVTCDVAALTIKSGNAVVLRGGKDAINSNRTLYGIMKNALKKNNYNDGVIQFIDDKSRESTLKMLKMGDYIDVVIPRGGDGLKKFVLENAVMPVIASAGGNCHIYVDESADIEMAVNIVENAKISRPSVCNACEQLLINSKIAEKAVPAILSKLKNDGVKILGCDKTRIYFDCEKASDEDYYTEHQDMVISVKIVDSLDEAINWINRHSTNHTEAIITKDNGSAMRFAREVDSAAVFVNASTRFTDGYELGLGAEIGISTQKLHARGPLGINELTSVKYFCEGNGQIRK